MATNRWSGVIATGDAPKYARPIATRVIRRGFEQWFDLRGNLRSGSAPCTFHSRTRVPKKVTLVVGSVPSSVAFRQPWSSSTVKSWSAFVHWRSATQVRLPAICCASAFVGSPPSAACQT